MDNYKNYFDKERPKPKWFLGDRVTGTYNKIPFIGTVLNDNIVKEDFIPQVSVYLDLPLKYKSEYKNIIFVEQKKLKKLKEY
jgi:hypothetical protein